MSDQTPKNKPTPNTHDSIADFQDHLSRMQQVKARIKAFLERRKVSPKE